VSARLAIIAGGGTLPNLLAETCRAQGRDFRLVALSGAADAALDAAADARFRIGAAGGLLKYLKGEGVEELVFAGKVERPGARDLRPDLRTMKFLARLGSRSLGDDGLLRAILREFEAEGFRIVGPDEILSELLAPAGPLGAVVPDETAQADIARGCEVLASLGPADVGQCVVVQQGVVLGVEAVEGTDALLARARELRRDGPGGVLVKLPKPGQDRRIDLPAIGARTVTGAAEAGLRGIAVAAGATLLIDPAAVRETADAAGLFVVGIEAP
jgi:DUF1009 family protein